MAKDGKTGRRAAERLAQKYGKLTLGEWISLTLAVLGLVLVFCLFFIRRQTLDYHLEHTFTVRSPEFFGSALALTDPVPVGGNKIELLQNGDEYFPAMLDAIRSARQTINFASYIMKSDGVGHQFRDALCERARAGVEVRVLLDGIGSGWSLDNSDVRMMTDAGCKFAYYHPVHSWRMDRTNRRSHRRVLVVDGKVGFTGGAAFADKWSGHAQDEHHWRDTQVRMEGPIVNSLQSAFQGHWGEDVPRSTYRRGAVSRAAARGRSENADRGIAFLLERADSAAAGGHVCCGGETDLDCESVLHPHRRPG